MSGRGGKRARAGRKKGSLSIRTRKIAEEAIEDSITPLEVMLMAMRHCLRQGDLLEAAGIARYAAPYMHPRISPNEITKEQWEEEHRQKQKQLMDAVMKSTEAAIQASRARFEDSIHPK